MIRQPDGIEALTDAGVEFLDYREALALAIDNSDVALRLWWQIAEDERRLHTWVVGLGRADAEERIAAMIVDFDHRLRPSGLSSRQGFRLPMTQLQMADYLGLTVVHVNRVLRRFREANVFLVQRGRVEIQNYDALLRAARPVLDVFDRDPMTGSDNGPTDPVNPARVPTDGAAS